MSGCWRCWLCGSDRTVRLSSSRERRHRRALLPPRRLPAALTGQAQIDRGKMLVIGGGCHDCHTPKKLGPNGPEFDYDRALSGQPAGEKIDRAVQERSQESLAGSRER